MYSFDLSTAMNLRLSVSSPLPVASLGLLKVEEGAIGQKEMTKIEMILMATAVGLGQAVTLYL